MAHSVRPKRDLQAEEWLTGGSFFQHLSFIIALPLQAWGKRPLGGKHQDVVPGLLFLSPSRVPLGQTLVPMDALGDLESVAFSR